MALPDDLQLSQASLQDFVDCRRRFQLRYLLRRAWPAIPAEPVQDYESHLRRASLFHRLVQQSILGVPLDALSALAANEGIGDWWANFSAAAPADLPGQRQPEIVLSAPLGPFRLMAKYDLVVIAPEGRATILDWKTSRRRTPRPWLSRRLQTRVYPYLLAEAGHDLNRGRPIAPDQITMIYWFADFPDQPERFVYSAGQHRENAGYLAGLVEQMTLLAGGDGDWPLTPLERNCRFCVYRSLCDRGVEAGHLDDADLDLEDFVPESFDVEIDFEQIGEIAF